jgi:hypothetical protein
MSAASSAPSFSSPAADKTASADSPASHTQPSSPAGDAATSEPSTFSAFGAGVKEIHNGLS